MKLAIVANHSIKPTASIVVRIAAALAVISEDDPGSELFVRADASARVVGAVDRVAVDVANNLDVAHTYFCAALGGSRKATFDRDWEMVNKSDRVMAFFDRNMDLHSGTAHVVHAAIQKSVSVEAWSVDEDGMLSLIGSDDGYEMNSEGIDWFHQQWETSRIEEYEKSIYKGVSELGLYTTATPLIIGTSTTSANGFAIGNGTTWTTKTSFDLS